ncbi:MAG: hypothetical protein IT512_00225 [Rhodocyclaceae bacterium]|nr:hypothetical protein [Rhodocyclaceae bacterium]
MLPPILRGPCRFDFSSKEWKEYLSLIGRYEKFVDREFLRQVTYDHFDHFNAHYPWFEIESAKFERICLTATEIYKKIRYFDGQSLDFWYEHFDELRKRPQQYEIFSAMVTNLTWPFPPIALQVKMTKEVDQPLGALGKPLHLIEGTHRVSYLCRMLELKMIDAASRHEVVIVTTH